MKKYLIGLLLCLLSVSASVALQDPNALIHYRVQFVTQKAAGYPESKVVNVEYCLVNKYYNAFAKAMTNKDGIADFSIKASQASYLNVKGATDGSYFRQLDTGGKPVRCPYWNITSYVENNTLKRKVNTSLKKFQPPAI